MGDQPLMNKGSALVWHFRYFYSVTLLVPGQLVVLDIIDGQPSISEQIKNIGRSIF